MTVTLDDPFGEWSDLLDKAVMDAMRKWLAEIEPDLYPTLVSAAEDDEQPPNLEALLAAVTAWEAIVADELSPLIVGLVAARLAHVADRRDIDLTDVTGQPTLRPDLEDMFTAARAAVERAGIDPTVVDRVVRVPSWVDFIDDYARQTVNMVRGMPETAYRDLVTKLSAATRDGMNPWERSRLARDYLSMRSEGGYDQWMTRAQRISRTESNRMINAADMTAAQTEQSITGDEMHKAWVASMDERTRSEHFAADGQRVPLDGKFLIGGYEADHPGDPNLPAHLSIQCRCTTVILAADEPLPGEDDRQTERERADGTTRDLQAEVRRRAADGVTRARDDDPQTVTAAAPEEQHTMRTTFSAVLAPVGKATGDGRIIDPDADITYRDFPLPLLFQRASNEGHDTAVVVGKITEATADGETLAAVGEFFDNTDAAEAKDLVAEGVIKPSVDMADMTVEWELVDADGNPVDLEADDWEPGEVREIMHIRGAEIVAATLVSKPAFADAKIELGDEAEPQEGEDDQPEGEEVAALTAAAALADTPAATASAFEDPQLPGPTALTVDDGRVYGHLALWGTEHVAMPGKKVTPPQSTTDYAMFHVSTIHTDDGPLPCGRLTVGTGHADAAAGMRAATAHYDETGTCWAMVRAGEDQHGIWVAGVTNPDADEATIRKGAAAPLSGDWRSVGGNLELVAALSVNTPGFPVPRSYSVHEGAELSLVAAAVVPRRNRQDEMAAAVAEGLRRHDERRERQAEQARQEDRNAQLRRMTAALFAQEVSR